MSGAGAALPLDSRLFYDLLGSPPGSPARLRAARCGQCERHEFMVRDTCPACGAAMEPTALSADATLTGFTAVLHQPPGALVDAPYLVGVASFPEGVSVLGLVVGCGLEDLAIGQPVETISVLVGDRITFAYRPAGVGDIKFRSTIRRSAE